MGLSSLQTIGLSAAGAFILGTAGGGWIVHKLWWGKSQAEKLEAVTNERDAAISAQELSVQNMELAAGANEILRATNAALQANVTGLAADNATLAASRAPRIETIYREAEGARNEAQLQGRTSECDFERVSDGLREWAFPRRQDRPAVLSMAGAS